MSWNGKCHIIDIRQTHARTHTWAITRAATRGFGTAVPLAPEPSDGTLNCSIFSRSYITAIVYNFAIQLALDLEYASVDRIRLDSLCFFSCFSIFAPNLLRNLFTQICTAFEKMECFMYNIANYVFVHKHRQRPNSRSTIRVCFWTDSFKICAGWRWDAWPEKLYAMFAATKSPANRQEKIIIISVQC